MHSSHRAVACGFRASISAATLGTLAPAFAADEFQVTAAPMLSLRGQAHEASNAAEQAGLEVSRWHHRLLIDAHFIWRLADE